VTIQIPMNTTFTKDSKANNGTAPEDGKATRPKDRDGVATRRATVNGKITVPKDTSGEAVDGSTMGRKATGGAVTEVGTRETTPKGTGGTATNPKATDGTTIRPKVMTGTEHKSTGGTKIKHTVTDGKGTSRKAMEASATATTTKEDAGVIKARSGSFSHLFSTACSVAVKEDGARAVVLGEVQATETAAGKGTAAGVGMVTTTDLEVAVTEM
jgi:hypothetical protein